MRCMKSIPQKHFIEDDVVLVHKPVGISSFGLLKKLRPLLGTRKIGHAGTLDPLASGLMIVGFNKGTKKMNHYLKLPKTYITNILVGYSTTTGDSEGEIVEKKYPLSADIKKKHLEDVLLSMRGHHTLQVPIYSAIKVQGRPLYDYARNNQEPPYIPEKDMIINQVQYLDSYKSGDYYIVRARFDVASGTYIRTLGEEFGRRIGYPAHLKKLERIAIDVHNNQNAYRLNTGRGGVSGWFRAIIKKLIG